MKILFCLLTFAFTVNGGLLPHLEAPPLAGSDKLAHQIPETKIIKLGHEATSNPHATLPTSALKILKVTHESAANVAELAAPVAGPLQIIKVIHQSNSHPDSQSVYPKKILKIVHQTPAPGLAVASSNTKLLKIIHEYAPKHFLPAPYQSTEVIKTVKPHPAPVGQNIQVYNILRQAGAAGTDILSSHRHSYARGYDHGHASPTSTVKVIKVLKKPAYKLYPSSSSW